VCHEEGTSGDDTKSGDKKASKIVLYGIKGAEEDKLQKQAEQGYIGPFRPWKGI
jgi:hypothetical protein